MALPINTLSSLHSLQDDEDHKPAPPPHDGALAPSTRDDVKYVPADLRVTSQLSKISWLPDVLVFHSSIIPTVLGPVLSVSLFASSVAVAALMWGKQVGLTNDVVPLLSVVVGLLLGRGMERNSSAYERYAEFTPSRTPSIYGVAGRRDFTSLISGARNLSRRIWVSVTVPTPPTDESQPSITRARLTEEKKKLIRLVVAFVIATKHHLRAEGGVHHDDLKGAPASSIRLGKSRAQRASTPSPSVKLLLISDEEASLGLPTSTSPALRHSPSVSSDARLSQSPLPQSPASELPHLSFARPAIDRIKNPSGALKRRPTAGPVHTLPPHLVGVSDNGKKRIDERTPLIKPGVKPDVRRTPEDVRAAAETIKRVEIGLERMVELGLPLIIAHEISRTIFRWSRMGCLEAIGPAGMDAMQGLVQSMTDQLGAMERMFSALPPEALTGMGQHNQTPLPVIFGVHLKQTVTLFLCILPFTLVDLMGWKMVVIVTCCAFTMMGVEHIAAQEEMPFGTDPGDLNLDLFCTELLCECEAILELLPEGDEDENDIFLRSAEQADIDEWADDGADGE
ncbi:hypothetical protein EHS25_003939 [Saitozyma podzolica]|uniref:Uncharacterized protein n=1 Tax=Saitozyma podzolica TaxID=1890683 RepID=A0A427YSX9_9TREE|nr:hypothetical protein EHS25_003939 [Saitozyma podzolica]